MNGPCSACGDGDTAMRYHSHDIRDPLITTQQGRLSNERLYTLKEVEELAKEWAKTQDLTSNDCWLISHLFAWLKRREKNDD